MSDLLLALRLLSSKHLRLFTGPLMAVINIYIAYFLSSYKILPSGFLRHFGLGSSSLALNISVSSEISYFHLWEFMIYCLFSYRFCCFPWAPEPRVALSWEPSLTSTSRLLMLKTTYAFKISNGKLKPISSLRLLVLSGGHGSGRVGFLL